MGQALSMCCRLLDLKTPSHVNEGKQQVFHWSGNVG